MPSKASERQTRYDNNHTIQYSLKLNLKTDKDIIEAIEKINSKNKQGAIKELIRKAIEKEEI